MDNRNTVRWCFYVLRRLLHGLASFNIGVPAEGVAEGQGTPTADCLTLTPIAVLAQMDGQFAPCSWRSFMAANNEEHKAGDNWLFAG